MAYTGETGRHLFKTRDRHPLKKDSYVTPNFTCVDPLFKYLNIEGRHIRFDSLDLSAPISAFQSDKPIPYEEKRGQIVVAVENGEATYTSCTIPLSNAGKKIYCPFSVNIRQRVPDKTLEAIPVTRQVLENQRASNQFLQTGMRLLQLQQHTAQESADASAISQEITTLQQFAGLLTAAKDQPNLTPVINSTYENPISVDGYAFYANTHHSVMPLEFDPTASNVTDISTIYDKKTRHLVVTVLSHPFNTHTGTFDVVKTDYQVKKSRHGLISSEFVATKVIFPEDKAEKTDRDPFLKRLAALVQGATQEQIIKEAKKYVTAYKHWEFVRLQRATVLLHGATLNGELVRTGWEGYLDFSKSHDDLIVDLANIGIAIIDKIGAECAMDKGALNVVENVLSGKKLSIEGLLILEKVFLDQRLECLQQVASRRSAYEQFRDETIELTDTWDLASYRRQPDGSFTEEKIIVSPPIELHSVDGLLTDAQKAGLKAAMEIGIVGNENVRALLDIYHKKTNPVLPAVKRKTYIM